MEGLVGGERRNSEIAEVYLNGSHVQARPSTGNSLISEADWGLPSLDHGNIKNETTELLGGKGEPTTSRRASSSSSAGNCDGTTSFLAEIPAILVTLLINFMTAIPFGVSYFPLGWSNDYNDNNNYSGENEGDGIVGSFPLPGKEALGIRMFLMASITGQIALSLASKFKSPVSVQLIENVPFYHALAGIVIAEQGYGPEALSTLFFLFGLSSFSTGLLFYGLGRSGLGRTVHYFPSHVLVGFIGGIGVFIGVSSIGVLTGEELRYTPEGLRRLASNFEQLAPSLALEIVLRILMVALTDETGKQRFGLLVPFFFLSIVPMFYVRLFFCGIEMDEATDRGYFFPAASPEESPPASGGGDPVLSPEQQTSLWAGIFDGHVLDIFRVVDLKTVSWKAVFNSLGTIVGLSCFSVINVPINIPAFANTCKVDVDMNNELMAHGYSNMLAGLLGGIQNVMTYSVSVLFYKSGGNSMAAQISLILGTMLFFVVGVVIIPYIPKCMAGTLLLHIGVDLFIEGVCDSIEEYDKIEYGGVGSTNSWKRLISDRSHMAGLIIYLSISNARECLPSFVVP
jgi:SulP family sulfate permease